MTQKYTLLEKASELTPEALLFLANLDLNYFPTPWGLEDWKRIFNTERQRAIFLSEQDNVIIGFALFDIVAADSFAHLLKIIINPQWRGKELGKKLLNEAINILKNKNIKTFFLEVEEHNTVAVKLYEQIGFEIIHHKKHFYSSGANAFIMTLIV
jgi:ribosomal-protein-alanine acetyltransferase